MGFKLLNNKINYKVTIKLSWCKCWTKDRRVAQLNIIFASR